MVDITIDAYTAFEFALAIGVGWCLGNVAVHSATNTINYLIYRYQRWRYNREKKRAEEEATALKQELAKITPLPTNDGGGHYR